MLWILPQGPSEAGTQGTGTPVTKKQVVKDWHLALRNWDWILKIVNNYSFRNWRCLFQKSKTLFILNSFKNWQYYSHECAICSAGLMEKWGLDNYEGKWPSFHWCLIFNVFNNKSKFFVALKKVHWNCAYKIHWQQNNYLATIDVYLSFVVF